jgi:hypothetical protein
MPLTASALRFAEPDAAEVLAERAVGLFLGATPPPTGQYRIADVALAAVIVVGSPADGAVTLLHAAALVAAHYERQP